MDPCSDRQAIRLSLGSCKLNKQRCGILFMFLFFFFSLLFLMRNKIVNTPMTIVAIVGMIVFLAAGSVMTVYPKAGMVKEFGVKFALAVQYSFLTGLVMVILALVLSEKKA